MAAVVAACSPGPGGTSRPVSVDVSIASAAGEALAFEPPEIAVEAAGWSPGGRAGEFAVGVTFRNASSVAHNLTFTGAVAVATRTIVEPGFSERVVVVPPAPGAYAFVCTIHPGMAGMLVVRSGSARR